ncbi:hypothetical protein ABXT70_08265 [Candidatus Njordibacter sp. Uisw_039]|jgi:DNA-binding transcriptional ArsR family regulator|uniref:hypothetical protein n=1 Tax=Candidatus Njordibacter sp. Uisw_039 TaxID=3230972 RepID=UPI003A23C6C3|tara:strand:- start:2029 stop:2328 length:300 start_codon:yes stop_codon:yes gene_type:complete
MDLHLLQPNISQHISSVEHLQVELLMLYGDSCDIGEGKHYTSLTQRGLKRLMKDMRHVQQHLKSLRNTYLIDADGETVLTVGHKYDHVSTGRGASRASY